MPGWRERAIAEPVKSGWRERAIPEQKYQDGFKKLELSDIPQGVADAASSFKEAAIPLYEGAAKLGSAGFAGLQSVTDVVRPEDKQKTFGEHYDEAEAMRRNERLQREARSPVATGVGTGAGVIASMGTIPIAKAGKTIGFGTRALMGPGLATAEGLTSGEEPLDFERAKQAGTIAGGAQLAMETLPVVGKGVSKLSFAVFKKAARIMGGPEEKIINEYVQNAERINKAPSEEELADLIGEKAGKYYEAIDQAKQDVLLARSGVSEAKGAFSAAKSGLTSQLKETRPPATFGADVGEALTGASKKMGQLSSEAYDIVAKEGVTVPTKRLKGYLSSQINQLKIAGTTPVSRSAKATLNELQKLRDSLDELPSELPGTEVKKLIQSIDPDINWGRQSGDYPEQLDTALQGFRRALDKNLKKYPAYSEKMTEIAPLANLQKKMVPAFGTPQKAEEAINAIASGSPKGAVYKKHLQEFDQRHGTNFASQLGQFLTAKETLRTPSKMKGAIERLPEYGHLQRAEEGLTQAELGLIANRQFEKPLAALKSGRLEPKIRAAGRGDNKQVEESLKFLDDLEGTSLTQQTRDRSILREFDTPRPMGSSVVNAAALIGRATAGAGAGYETSNSMEGAAAGAIAGLAANKYAGKITKGILDAAQGTKYFLPLYNAAKQGKVSFSAAHSVLLEKDREYRDLMRSRGLEQ